MILSTHLKSKSFDDNRFNGLIVNDFNPRFFSREMFQKKKEGNKIFPSSTVIFRDCQQHFTITIEFIICLGEFLRFLAWPKIWVHMGFFGWHVFIRSIESKNRWVAHLGGIFHNGGNSKWWISEIDQISISLNMIILYIARKLFIQFNQFRTTFLLTIKPKNEPSESNITAGVSIVVECSLSVR